MLPAPPHLNQPQPHHHEKQDPAAFKASHWEQRPRVFKATPERAAFFRGLLALPHYLDLARRREGQGRPFHCAADVNAARYRNGRRETLTVEVGAVGIGWVDGWWSWGVCGV